MEIIENLTSFATLLESRVLCHSLCVSDTRHAESHTHAGAQSTKGSEDARELFE